MTRFSDARGMSDKQIKEEIGEINDFMEHRKKIRDILDTEHSNNYLFGSLEDIIRHKHKRERIIPPNCLNRLRTLQAELNSRESVNREFD